MDNGRRSTGEGAHAAIPTSTTTGTTNNVSLTWNIQADVQAWVNGTSNYGTLIKDGTESSGTARTATFASEENATTANRPQLVIDFTPFKIVKQTAPVYPPEAKAQGVQGTVKLQVTIEIDGSVKVLGVISGDPLLSPAATSAVRQWRYEPSRIKGQPVPTDTAIEVNFVLNRQP